MVYLVQNKCFFPNELPSFFLIQFNCIANEIISICVTCEQKFINSVNLVKRNYKSYRSSSHRSCVIVRYIIVVNNVLNKKFISKIVHISNYIYK